MGRVRPQAAGQVIIVAVPHESIKSIVFIYSIDLGYPPDLRVSATSPPSPTIGISAARRSGSRSLRLCRVTAVLRADIVLADHARASHAPEPLIADTASEASSNVTGKTATDRQRPVRRGQPHALLSAARTSPCRSACPAQAARRQQAALPATVELPQRARGPCLLRALGGRAQVAAAALPQLVRMIDLHRDCITPCCDPNNPGQPRLGLGAEQHTCPATQRLRLPRRGCLKLEIVASFSPPLPKHAGNDPH